MHITYVSIFPEIFDSFVNTSLVQKAIHRGQVTLDRVDPRAYACDKHRTVDDTVYGGGQGMLLKAEPLIQALMHCISRYELTKSDTNRRIVFVGPSSTLFSQHIAQQSIGLSHVVFVCGRYEGWDHRVLVRARSHFPHQTVCRSLGRFITLGGETPAMVMTEALVRLLPGVIKEEASWKEESYSPEHRMKNLEYPQYTRPQEVEGMKVPDVLLSGNHARIAQRKEIHQHISDDTTRDINDIHQDNPSLQKSRQDARADTGGDSLDLL